MWRTYDKITSKHQLRQGPRSLTRQTERFSSLLNYNNRAQLNWWSDLNNKRQIIKNIWKILSISPHQFLLPTVLALSSQTNCIHNQAFIFFMSQAGSVQDLIPLSLSLPLSHTKTRTRRMFSVWKLLTQSTNFCPITSSVADNGQLIIPSSQIIPHTFNKAQDTPVS